LCPTSGTRCAPEFWGDNPKTAAKVKKIATSNPILSPTKIQAVFLWKSHKPFLQKTAEQQGCPNAILVNLKKKW
jgi:hypothetical protein